jgi:hypothetical protein
MARSSYAGSNSQRSVFSSLLGPVVLVAVAGLVGWLLLVTVKWLVVTLLIALGVALIIVPFFVGRRVIGVSVGGERAGRVGQLATAVLLGVALIAVALVVRHHGWLIVAVPVAVVLIGRLWAKASAARAERRARQFH